MLKKIIPFGRSCEVCVPVCARTRVPVCVCKIVCLVHLCRFGGFLFFLDLVVLSVLTNVA